jgi:hypothetical protein
VQIKEIDRALSLMGAFGKMSVWRLTPEGKEKSGWLLGGC